MSELTTRLCAEHRHIPGTHLPDQCPCGWEADDGTAGTWQQHFAQAVEAAIRDHVAREIEAERERNEVANAATTATGLYIRSTIAASYNNAAHIARGGRP